MIFFLSKSLFFMHLNDTLSLWCQYAPTPKLTLLYDDNPFVLMLSLDFLISCEEVLVLSLLVLALHKERIDKWHWEILGAEPLVCILTLLIPHSKW
jgi:hypothetical protein